ncbi:MAG TPA: IS1595 family transposase [Bryobacteraceae bacterium]|nr:IS1595 family transposase [Bryobacteraceae bacterium]
MESPATLRDAVIWFADFDHCREFMAQLRWPDGVVKCPHCGSDNVTWLAKARIWKCYAKHARPTFTLKTGTIFEDSPIPLEKWLCAAWLLIGCKNGVSSYEIHRDLGVTQKSAWFMLHRLRLAMREGGFKIGGSGKDVEADETFIGGRVDFMHRGSKRLKRANTEGMWGKTVVLGLLERDGRARAAVSPTRKYYEIHQHVTANVEPGTNLITDEFQAYATLPKDYTHEVIDKTYGYVNGKIHVNSMENFWSLLKRTLKGTYVSVDPCHLQAYVDEQVFRFNNRKDVDGNPISDAERFTTLMKQIVGLRLTYNELTGKTPFTVVEAGMRP